MLIDRSEQDEDKRHKRSVTSSPRFWTQPSFTTFWSLMVASPLLSPASCCRDAGGTVDATAALAGQVSLLPDRSSPGLSLSLPLTSSLLRSRPLKRPHFSLLLLLLLGCCGFLRLFSLEGNRGREGEGKHTRVSGGLPLPLIVPTLSTLPASSPLSPPLLPPLLFLSLLSSQSGLSCDVAESIF